MTQTEERRAQGVNRVPYETLVEVCSNDPSIPAFEAESVDVSGRGMHVRTAYLPGLGDSLVCRMEDRGREILVEGVVAWRAEQPRGGEFGLRFTALDSGSVEALRDLCSPAEREEMQAQPEAPASEPQNPRGSKVRLHIDGLGAPMKARVRDAGQQQLHVGSNLEFLKVGKRLEIEDVEQNARRIARIDTVSVSIDPETNVPQLVVGLRYEGRSDAEESTPEPSVVDARAADAGDELPQLSRSRSRSSDAPEPGHDEAEDDEADALRSAQAAAKLGQIAAGASAFARGAGATVARLGSGAARHVSGWVRGASKKVGQQASKGSKPAVRRTAPAPAPAPAEGRRLRPQSAKTAERPAAPTPRPTLKKVSVIAGASVLAVSAAAYALKGPDASVSGHQPAAQAAPAQAVGARLDEQGKVQGVTPLSTVPVDPSKPPTAHVPLFGETALTTREPVPLAAPPEELAAAGQAAPAAADAPKAADQSWSEDDEEESDAEPEKPKVRPEDVKPWGRGKLKEPTVHRLRLDAPGAAIQGHPDPTGFTVLVPGRKLMENGSAIAKRDKRIARVRTHSNEAGAELTFQFRDGIPAYRVRLRKDFVEVLVSAEESKKDRGKASASSSKNSAKSSKKTSSKRDD